MKKAKNSTSKKTKPEKKSHAPFLAKEFWESDEWKNFIEVHRQYHHGIKEGQEEFAERLDKIEKSSKTFRQLTTGNLIIMFGLIIGIIFVLSSHAASIGELFGYAKKISDERGEKLKAFEAKAAKE